MAIKYGPVGDGVALISISHPKGPALKRGRPTKEVAKRRADAIETIEIVIDKRRRVGLKVGRPRIEDRDKTLAATKPWLSLGMSRRTWFDRKAKGELK